MSEMMTTILKVFGMLLVCVATLTPGAAAAQTAGEKAINTCLFPFRKAFSSGPRRACISQNQCGDDQSCVSGFCKLKADVVYKTSEQREAERKSESSKPSNVVASPNQTTEQECSADRRCRIDRLRRRNQARRYQTMLEEEQRAMEFQNSVNQRRLDAKPRTSKPLAAEFYVSFGFGLAGSYMVSDHLRLEGTFTRIDAYVDAEVTTGGQRTYSSGYIDGWNVGGSATYLMRTKWWTPYLSVAMIAHSGNFSSYGSFGEFDFDFGSGSDTQSILHLVEGRFGFDAQFKRGLRARLGVLYRYPIYSLAKFGPGNYDDASTDVLEAWIKSSRRIAPEFSIGWAF